MKDDLQLVLVQDALNTYEFPAFLDAGTSYHRTYIDEEDLHHHDLSLYDNA